MHVFLFDVADLELGTESTRMLDLLYALGCFKCQRHCVGRLESLQPDRAYACHFD